MLKPSIGNSPFGASNSTGLHIGPVLINIQRQRGKKFVTKNLDHQPLLILTLCYILLIEKNN